MKTCVSLSTIVIITLAASILFAADPANFAGEYADKDFLKGKSVIALSLEQKGSEVSVFFSGGHNDGHGAAPEAEGSGKVTAKGTLEFTWKDSFDNSGSGTIRRDGKDVIVSMNPTHVAEARCLVFYQQNMRLKPAAAGKKLGKGH